MSTVYITLQQEAELALQAAGQRLTRAQQGVKDFAASHHGCGMPSDIEIELDEALRNFAKAERDLRELRG
jgi:hypothetical protein